MITITVIFWTSIFVSASLDLFDDGLPAPGQAYLKVCSAMSEVGLNDMKTGTTPVILSSQEQEVLSSSATTVQKRSVLRTEEIVSIFYPK